MENKQDKGFTLVELLIVIVILGILATVTVFAVRGITDKGQENACVGRAADARDGRRGVLRRLRSTHDLPGRRWPPSRTGGFVKAATGRHRGLRQPAAVTPTAPASAPRHRLIRL